MASSSITLDLGQSMLANLLDKPDKSTFVYGLTGSEDVFDLFIENRATPRKVVGKNGVFQKAVMGTDATLGTVQSAVVQPNGNLLVTFNAPAPFRAKTLIGDGTAAMNQGYCVNATATTVELQPPSNIGSWNTATQFLAGSYAVEMVSAAGQINGTPPDPQYQVPQYYTNQTGVIYEKEIISEGDMSATWVETDGKKYWAYAQDMLMLKRFNRKRDLRSVWGNYGFVNTANSGMVQVPRGLREAVQDPLYGGIYTPLNNLCTPAQFDKFLTDCAVRTNCWNFTLFMGVGMYSLIQNFAKVQNSIQFSGNTNTFGGKEVKGFNIPVYASNGVMCTIVMTPLFNDIYYFPATSTVTGANFSRMSYTCVAVPNKDYTDPTTGRVLPTVEKVYFGNREVSYGIMNGVGMGDGPNSQGFTTSGQFVTQEGASTTLLIRSNCATDWMMYGGGWMELVQ